MFLSHTTHAGLVLDVVLEALPIPALLPVVVLLLHQLLVLLLAGEQELRIGKPDKNGFASYEI